MHSDAHAYDGVFYQDQEQDLLGITHLHDIIVLVMMPGSVSLSSRILTVILVRIQIIALTHYLHSHYNVDNDTNWFAMEKLNYLDLPRICARLETSIPVINESLTDGAFKVDINYQNQEGWTPLYYACCEGKISFVCKLLYYGANPNIPANNGLLPLTAIPVSLPERDYELLLDILFPYTFDSDHTTVSLPVLAKALKQKSSLFSRIAEIVTDVVYDADDIRIFCASFTSVRAVNIEVFIKKYGYVVKDLMVNGLLCEVLASAYRISLVELGKIVDALLSSKYICKLVQTGKEILVYRSNGGWCATNKVISFVSVISCFIKVFGRDGTWNEEEITRKVLLMVSYGLEVTRQDLETVYERYGYCDLFRILLHMDVRENTICRFAQKERSFNVLLYCNPIVSIDEVGLVNCFRYNIPSLSSLLHYFNHPKLKKTCLTLINSEEVVNKVKNMPDVPCLVELSRNVARKHIVKIYQVKTSKQYLTILNGLPIDKVTKSVLALEQKLY